MRRAILVLASASLAVVLLLGVFGGVSAPVDARTTSKKPNFVFILADDMRYDDLKYMPKTRALLGGGGKNFKQHFVSLATCCPSRATILRGQYAHNHRVWFNENGPEGGWKGFQARGYERANLATRLHDAGYRTGLFGKYLNDYFGASVPRGWDDWFALLEPGKYFNYGVNDTGRIKRFGGGSNYVTDVLNRQTQEFINASVAQRKPFLAYVAPTAPHTPTIPAPRDQHTYDGLKAPRLPSFNERDVSDKPPWIQRLPLFSADRINQIDKEQENRAETLQALDDLVAGVVTRLKNKGVLSNTYIFFTSDNGWESGEHRIPDAKRQPYEESHHVPLLVRGPGVAAGSTTSKLTLNTDFFPTLATLARTQPPGYVDGRSLQPILNGRATAWRTAVLLETRYESGSRPDWSGIRTSNGQKYIAAGGNGELYNLSTDPFELRNRFNATTPTSSLAKRLQALKGCARDSCRSRENAR